MLVLLVHSVDHDRFSPNLQKIIFDYYTAKYPENIYIGPVYRNMIPISHRHEHMHFEFLSLDTINKILQEKLFGKSYSSDQLEDMTEELLISITNMVCSKDKDSRKLGYSLLSNKLYEIDFDYREVLLDLLILSDLEDTLLDYMRYFYDIFPDSIDLAFEDWIGRERDRPIDELSKTIQKSYKDIHNRSN